MELGIKGNETRGDEIIKILEMLGGKNRHEMRGSIYNNYFYYIDGEYKDISYSYIGPDEINGYKIFSLDEFLEKFPYRVGDKVNVWINEDCFGGRRYLTDSEIISMRWNSDCCEIAYRLKNIDGEFYKSDIYKSDITGKVNDEENKMNDCKKCGRHFGSVQCFDKDFCPHNKPKSYAVGLMDDKVNECEANKEIVMNENKPLFKPGDVVKLKGCPDKNLYWIVMDVIKDGYIFNDGKKYLFDVQHNYEKSNREVINLKPDKIAYLSINNEKYADQIEIDLGDDYEYKFEMNKLYIVKKNPTYPKTYEEDNYCETLEIKVLGYKVGDVIFTNNAGWIKITNKLWDCYAKEHVYEGIGVLNEQEYDNIRHKDIINKMETDSVIENMKESITPSPHITANITDKNNCDIECPDMLDADKNLFHTTNEYEEIVEKSFQGGYEKCKSEMNMNDNNVDLTLKISTCYVLPDGYHFTDENGNVIDTTKIRLVKNTPYYPKSYDECCDVLSMEYAILYNLRYHTYEHGYYEFTTSDKLCSLQDKLNILGKLIICRNAYWEIAGEYLELNKPWEPDFSDDSPKYNIFKYENEITLSDNNWSNRILVFPTLEMRNAFYENFKHLIEQCKELL